MSERSGQDGGGGGNRTEPLHKNGRRTNSAESAQKCHRIQFQRSSSQQFQCAKYACTLQAHFRTNLLQIYCRFWPMSRCRRNLRRSSGICRSMSGESLKLSSRHIMPDAFSELLRSRPRNPYVISHVERRIAPQASQEASAVPSWPNLFSQ